METQIDTENKVEDRETYLSRSIIKCPVLYRLVLDGSTIHHASVEVNTETFGAESNFGLELFKRGKRQRI